MITCKLLGWQIAVVATLSAGLVLLGMAIASCAPPPPQVREYSPMAWEDKVRSVTCYIVRPTYAQDNTAAISCVKTGQGD